MKANKFKEMNDAELQAKLVDLKTEYFNLRFQNATGQLANPLKLGRSSAISLALRP